MISKCTHWDARFFLLCDMIASWSEDSSRKVGSVIVGPSNEIRSTGYNGLPRGVSSSHPNRHDRESGEKYLWFEHAERNAIYNAASTGTPTSGCRMYVNSYPCADCTRAVIQSGISSLCTFDFDPNDPKYGRHFVAAEQMLSEAGLDVKIFERSDPKITELGRNFERIRSDNNDLLR